MLDRDVVGVQMHRLGETGTMEQLYSSNAFFSSTVTKIHFKPESPGSSATCTTCGRRGASKKKKVWVHGLLQRVHPRLVGSSRENRKHAVKEQWPMTAFCKRTYMYLQRQRLQDEALVKALLQDMDPNPDLAIGPVGCP